MRVEWGNLALVGAIVLLLASIGINYMQMGEYKGLSEGYASLNASYEQDKGAWTDARQELSGQIKQLNEQGDTLQTQINGLQKALDEQTRQRQAAETALERAVSSVSEREAELAAQEARMQSLRTEFRGLQDDINGSMQWFRDNAVLKPNVSWNLDIIAPRVIEDCVDGQDLNLPCINHILERMATIRYRSDAVFNQSDHLQSLAETAARGSGDCEDYSLLFKAILNTVREKQGGLRIVAWEQGGGQNFIIYPKASLKLGPDEPYWYYPDAHGVDVGALDERHAYVICYTKTATEGHCTLALSNGEVGSSSQIANLNGGAVFEPQNGVYYGQVGAEFSICDPSRMQACTTTPNTIVSVITDSDLYRVQEGQWVGYGDYAKKMADALGTLK